MGEELELKLAMTPQALSRLRHHPLIRSLAGGRRARKLSLTTVYYDTPDRHLAARGIALRIRSDGKHFVQGLKAPLGNGRGLQSMAEYEAPLPDGRLDPTLIEDETLAALLAEPGIGDALAPVFETRIERYVLPVHLLDSEVEIAFDTGEVVAEAELAWLDQQLALLTYEQADMADIWIRAGWRAMALEASGASIGGVDWFAAVVAALKNTQRGTTEASP